MAEDKDDIEKLIRDYEINSGLSIATTYEDGEGDSKKVTSEVGSLDYRSRATERRIPELSKEISELADKINEAYATGQKEGKSLDEIIEEVKGLVQQKEEEWKEKRKKHNREYQEKLNYELFEEFYPIRDEMKKLEDELSYKEEGTKEYEDTLRRLEEVEDRYIEIRNSLVENNQELLYFILGGNATNLLKALPVSDYPFSDRIQEGYIGLINAVENYEPTKGKFSNYAVQTIKYYISNRQKVEADPTYSINNVSTIHIPNSIINNYYKINRARINLEETLGREPTDKEIAEETGFKPERIRRIEQAYELLRTESLDQDTGIVYAEEGQEIDIQNATKLPGEGMAEYYTMEDSRKNPGEVLRQGQAKVNGEILPEDEDMPYQITRRNELSEQIATALDKLSERERDIIEKKFGLTPDCKVWPLKEIASEYGLSRSRIGQIIKEALNTLGNDEKLQKYLSEYFEEDSTNGQENSEEDSVSKPKPEEHINEISTKSVSTSQKALEERLVNSAKEIESGREQERKRLQQSIFKKAKRVRELAIEERRIGRELDSTAEQLKALVRKYLEKFPQEKDKGEVDE